MADIDIHRSGLKREASAEVSPPAAAISNDLEDEMILSGVQIMIVTEEDDAADAYATLRHDVVVSGVIGVGQSTRPLVRWPQMVQIASSKTVVLETPSPSGGYSVALQQLMADPGITKVLAATKQGTAAFRAACPKIELEPTVDVCALARLPKRGPASLGAVLSYADPEGKTWTRKSASRCGWWALKTSEQMLREPSFTDHAAADAWGALLAYTMLQQGARAPSAPPHGQQQESRIQRRLQ